MNPNSTPLEGLYARESASGGESKDPGLGVTNAAQTGTQGLPLVDQIAAAIYEWSAQPHKWPDAHPDDVLAYRGDAYAVMPIIERLRANDHAALDRARAAAHVADDHDVTDWQRGYRACAERVLAALNDRQEQPTASPAEQCPTETHAINPDRCIRPARHTEPHTDAYGMHWEQS